MKPILENITHTHEQSFALREFKNPRFVYPWHSHPEYELTIIKEGSGKRYAGSSILNYDKTDLVLIGTNLPHCWISEVKSHSHIIQFREQFLGRDFLNNPEFKPIMALLNRSKSGIKFNGAIYNTISKSMEEMFSMNSFDKLLSFLKILNDLAKWKDYSLLSNKGFDLLGSENISDNERLNKISRFVQTKFKSNVTLEEVANLINMTPSSFCKYFKSRTKKTFIAYLNDFRIGYACRLIKETDMNMAQIAFESGFENLANFYRQFKKTTGYTPKEYRMV